MGIVESMEFAGIKAKVVGSGSFLGMGGVGYRGRMVQLSAYE